MVGQRDRPVDREGASNALDGVVFALLGLLVAFSFSSALDSYNGHRDLLTREANSISEAYAKLDLLEEAQRDSVRVLMRDYARERFNATTADVGSSEERKALKRSSELQNMIWTQVVSAVKESINPAVTSQIIDTFTAMDNAPADQLADQRNYMPAVIYILIFILSLLAALVAGYSMADRAHLPLFRVIIFSASIAVIMYVIIDLEYPRSGYFKAPSRNMPLAEIIGELS